jgi:hypothetical protein
MTDGAAATQFASGLASDFGPYVPVFPHAAELVCLASVPVLTNFSLKAVGPFRG